MIKNVIFAILQFLLFLVVFFVGSLFPPFHMEHVLGVTPEGTRIFVLDGVVLMSALFVVVLLIETARKRIQSAGVWTTVAFVLAMAAGTFEKFGLLTRPL